jgi:hypothetical protein
MHRAFILALLALGALTACTHQNQPTFWLDYQRTGGIAGVQDHLTIYADGRTVLERRDVQGEFTISPEQRQQIQAALNIIIAARIEGDNVPQDTCCDRYIYVIEYGENGQTHHFRTIDGNVPSRVQPLLLLLNALIETSA